MVLSRRKYEFVLPAFFLILGLALLLFFGPTQISCNRTSPSQSTCFLIRSVAFGFLEQDKIELSPLKSARLDTQIKQTIETDDKGRITKSERTIYNIVLVSDRDVLWNGGYGYVHKPHQTIVNQINDFLADPNQSTLDLSDRNYRANVLAFILLGVSGVTFWRV